MEVMSQTSTIATEHACIQDSCGRQQSRKMLDNCEKARLRLHPETSRPWPDVADASGGDSMTPCRQTTLW